MSKQLGEPKSGKLCGILTYEFLHRLREDGIWRHSFANVPSVAPNANATYPSESRARVHEFIQETFCPVRHGIAPMSNVASFLPELISQITVGETLSTRLAKYVLSPPRRSPWYSFQLELVDYSGLPGTRNAPSVKVVSQTPKRSIVIEAAIRARRGRTRAVQIRDIMFLLPESSSRPTTKQARFEGGREGIALSNDCVFQGEDSEPGLKLDFPRECGILQGRVSKLVSRKRQRELRKKDVDMTDVMDDLSKVVSRCSGMNTSAHAGFKFEPGTPWMRVNDAYIQNLERDWPN
ncbi:hypothetical protein B0H11DRAFT_1905340 [Mycena galericulata]|nr:hypothetical protein B0H11DRAFT_1905340 [Mycena galericulata]